MIICGIDNGLKGAISIITFESGRRSLKIFDMPIITERKSVTKRGTGKKVIKTRNSFDMPAIVNIFKKNKPVHAYLEYAQSMPSQSSQSTFNTGKGYGILMGIMSALGIKFDIVYSRTWQKEFFPEEAFTRLSKEERSKMSKPELARHKREVKKLICELSYKNAKRLFPKNTNDFGHESNRSDGIIFQDGRTDATLICEWGLRQYKLQHTI